MKISALHGYANTIILFAMLVINTMAVSDIGGSQTVYRTSIFLLAVLFLLLKSCFNRFLLASFSLPIIFLALSVFVNLQNMKSGGYNSMLSIVVGYMLLTLQPVMLDRTWMRRLIVVYLVSGLILSLYATMDNLVLNVMTGNANFNINPNSAAIYFTGCLILSLVFTKSLLRWVLAAMFSLLILTTGSRAGLVVGSMLLAGHVFFDMEGRRKGLLTKSKIAFLVSVATIPILASYAIPDSVKYLSTRVSNTGLVGIASSRYGDAARDTIWQSALDKSGKSLGTLLFGYGPATASDLIDTGTHSSYIEVITSEGWPFLIFTLVALLFLFRYHANHEQGGFLVYAIPILIYGAVETILFTGLGRLWYVFIFLSIYYRSTDFNRVACSGKGVNLQRA